MEKRKDDLNVKIKAKNFLESLFLVMLGIFSFPMIAHAQNAQDQLIMDNNYSFYVASTAWNNFDIWGVATEHPIKRVSDGAYVYCIQAHVEFLDGSLVTGYDNIHDQLVLSALSPEELERIRLYAYYGYGYGNHTNLDWYAATQILIWETTEKQAIPYPVAEGDKSLTRIDKYDAMMNEIKELVDHHGNTVSFNKQKVSMKAGETIQLKDTNGVLSHYFEVPTANDALAFSFDGNNLVITAKKGFEGEIDLKAKVNEMPPFIYDGAKQKCLSIGIPSFMDAKILLDVTTEFKFDKVYGDFDKGVYKPEESAVFELYNVETGNLVATLTTDENGEASIFLHFGTYRLHQIQGREGYKFIEDYFFTMDGTHTQEVAYFDNERIKATVTLHKVDEKGNALEGVLVGVYDLEGNLLGQYKTDKNGNIEVELEYGSYYWQEIATVEGHELNREKIYFEVTKDGEMIQDTLVNHTIKIKVPNTRYHENYVTEWMGIFFILVGSGGFTKLKTEERKKKRIFFKK